MPAGTLLNVNFPAGDVAGVEVARLGRRVYRDELQLEHEEAGPPARSRYWIYGRDPGFHEEAGTDLAAVAGDAAAFRPHIRARRGAVAQLRPRLIDRRAFR
jgi:5'-nucleotidase